MEQHDQSRHQSRKAALCGMMAALTVVILCLGGMIPLATFACAMLAMLCLIPAVCEYGAGTAALLYAAASILVLLLGIFITIAGSFGGAGGSVAASTVQREPLPAGSVTETGYYTDELGWIVDETMLVRGMRDFYKATGVQPYLYLTDNVDGNTEPSANEMGEFSARLYDQLFQDEGHFLLVYQEAWGNYMVGYTAGTQAKSIMDDEAVGILRDYLDRYNTSDLSDEEYFSTVFQKTGERIMTVTKSPWPVAAALLGAAALAAVLYLWWKKSKEKKEKEREQLQEMLNTPLTTFGNDQDGNGRDDARFYTNTISRAVPLTGTITTREETSGGGQNQ